MPTLAEIEEALVAYSYGERRPLLAWLSAGPGDPPGLRVHAGNCRGQLADALTSVYPVVRALVGGACFDGLARGYLRAHPSRHSDIHEFGVELAAFLAAIPELSSLDYLPDVARLEWAWHASYHATDEPPFKLAALAAVDEEVHGDLRFRLARHVHLLSCRYPVLAIWEAHQTTSFPSMPLVANREWTGYMVWRENTEPLITSLCRPEYELLGALGRGTALANALVDSAGPVDALARWVARGVIAGLAEHV